MGGTEVGSAEEPPEKPTKLLSPGSEADGAGDSGASPGAL